MPRIGDENLLVLRTRSLVGHLDASHFDRVSAPCEVLSIVQPTSSAQVADKLSAFFGPNGAEVLVVQCDPRHGAAVVHDSPSKVSHPAVAR